MVRRREPDLGTIPQSSLRRMIRERHLGKSWRMAASKLELERRVDNGGRSALSLDAIRDVVADKYPVADVDLDRVPSFEDMPAAGDDGRPVYSASDDVEQLQEVYGQRSVLVTKETLWKVVNSLNRESSAGASTTRYALVPQVFGGKDNPLLNTLLLPFIRILTLGRLDPLANSFFRTRRLALVPKPDGGHRPLGIGDALARVARMCVLATVLTQVRAIVGRYDLAVGTKDGTLILGMISQAAFDSGYSGTLGRDS